MNDFVIFDHVLDNLWLGNLFAAQADVSKSMDVIVNASNVRYPERPGVRYVVIDIDDVASADIAQHFDVIADLITSDPSKKVLIHCMAGASRSVALVLAVLLKRGMSLNVAFQRILSCRTSKYAVTQPNLGFVKALIDYERSLHGHSTFSLEDYLGMHGLRP